MSVFTLPERTQTLVRAAGWALKSSGSAPAMWPQAMPQQSITEHSQRHGMPAWTPGVTADARLVHARRGLAGIRRLIEIGKAFDATGIPAVAFKGPVFAHWLYGDACARRLGDLDLLVSQDRIREAVQVLEELGYRRRMQRGPDRLLHRWIGAVPMARRHGEEVDLHWRLAGPRFGASLAGDHVINESIPVSVAGHPFRAPRPEHAAIILVCHSAKHHWYALEYAFALAAMMRFKVVNWDAVYALLRSIGAVNAAATGFALVQSLFDLDAPAAFQQVARRREVTLLHGLAMRSLALPEGVFPDRRHDRRMQRLSLDRHVDRIRYDLLCAFEPTQADCEWLDLPDPLALLYWAVRPLRLGIRSLRSMAAARSSAPS